VYYYNYIIACCTDGGTIRAEEEMITLKANELAGFRVKPRRYIVASFIGNYVYSSANRKS